MLITFLWPWALAALPAVALAAAWALLRPMRQLAVVGSLQLWRQTLAELDKSHNPRSRRVTAAWAVLLLGACLAALALARPVWQSQRPQREIAICMYPSAEVSPQRAGEMRSAAMGLLDRLGPADKVQIVLPDVLGGASGFVSPDRARELIARSIVLPALAGELTLPPADPSAQRVYCFTPQPALIPQGLHIMVIPLAANLPAVTFEALGAELVDPNTVQVFCLLRNNTNEVRQVSIQPTALGSHTDSYSPPPLKSSAASAPKGREDIAGGAAPGSGSSNESSPERAQGTTIGPHQRQGVVFNLPVAPAIAFSLSDANGKITGPLGQAFIARESIIKAKVALVGDDDPMIRRFIRVHAGLELVAQAENADFIIANGPSAPVAGLGKPALIINPPTPPPGCLVGRRYQNVSLSAAAAVNEGVLKDVDLAGLAVRDLPTWQTPDAAGAGLLMTYDGQAVVLAVPASAAQPKAIYVSFDLSAGNTNLPFSPAFVTFLANAAAEMAGQANLQDRYLWRRPMDASISPDAQPVAIAGQWPPGPWPAPGLYALLGGQFEAVSLIGLRAEPTSASAPSAKSVDLPPQHLAAGSAELWPALAALAGLLWLAGWLLRTRA